jgi:DNA-binding SARP family transcriptional activator
MTLRIRLLGGFRVQLPDGSDLRLPRKKTSALIAYLAVHPAQRFLRDHVAALLWGDHSDQHARHTLRQILFELRRILPPGLTTFLVVDSQHISLDLTGAQVDVVCFERLAVEGRPDALAACLRLYTGEFLEGFAVDAAAFEEWLSAERGRLHELAIDAGARLLAHQMAAEDVEPAIQTALRLLALDPLQEVTHRSLMRLYARQGRRASACRQYQRCVDVLRRELGTAPDLSTSRLYAKILADGRAPERWTSGG